MSSQAKHQREPLITEAELLQAQLLAKTLGGLKSGRRKVQLQIEKQTVEVPEQAIPLIAEMMEKIGAGERVEVRTIHDTLSTSEAADILNVSRPYVVKLLDQGLMPFEATEGNHRRIKRSDLLEFKRQKDAEGRKRVDELAVEGQRLNREFPRER